MANLNTINGLHYEMMRRCYNKNSVSYKDYGARGIKVCDEWKDKEIFKKWCIKNGWTKDLRLNRKDSSKDYCPENCFFGNKNCKNLNSKNQKIKKNIEERKFKKNKAGIKGRIDKDELYICYRSMRNRCESKTHPSYYNYGGRGIKICKEWIGKYGFFNFKKWSMNNGWSIGLTLDRIDNNKGYSPDNCRWATMLQQNYNKRNNINYEYHGTLIPLGMIAKIENVKYGLLYSRVRLKGMSIDEAIEEIKESI